MAYRFLLLILASIMVGVLVLAAVGASPTIFRRSSAVHAADPPDWLTQRLRQLGLADDLARLKLLRQDLKDAGQRLGIRHADKSTLAHLASLLGLDNLKDIYNQTVGAMPGGGIVGVDLAGLVLAGLVGFPFVFAFQRLFRRLRRRHRHPIPAAH